MIRPATVLAAICLLAGCTSATPGDGGRSLSGQATVTATGASATGTSTPARGGGTSTRRGSPSRSSATSSAPTSPDPTALPRYSAFEVGTPSCAAASGTSTVTVSWTTSNTTEVWIGETPVASAAGDPRTTSGSKGPFGPTGSTTMPFDCRNDSDNYVLGLYNGQLKGSGVIQHIQRNTF